MENTLAVGILGGFVIGVIVVIALIALATYLRNKNRYDIPKYLPRDDEKAWALVSACSKRIWSLNKCKHLSYDNWDLGILKVNVEVINEYGTIPTFGDVILVPMKWGGTHALVITRELGNSQLITTYLGEFDGKARVIYDGRDRTRAKTIQSAS
jgi:hypothetical protein